MVSGHFKDKDRKDYDAHMIYVRRSELRILRVAFPGSAKGRFPDETVPTALLEIEKFRNDAPFIAFARGCLVSGMPLRNQTKGVEKLSNYYEDWRLAKSWRRK